MTYSGLFGFLIGIGLGSMFVFNIWSLISIFCIFIITIVYSYISGYKKFIKLNIFIGLLFLGILRIYYSDLYSVSELEKYLNKKIIVEGVVVTEPDVREKNTKYTISVDEIYYSEFEEGYKEINSKEKILVTLPLFPEYRYGDKLKINVSLVEPKEIVSEDGRVFDYKGYLRARGIWHVSRFSTAELLSSNNGNYIKSLLFKTKNNFTKSIRGIIREPQAGLLGGILLGNKQSLGKDILEKFQNTGVSHIVVLSGYNIAIVGETIINSLSFLPNSFSVLFGVTGIILFTILSGGGAGAIRAMIMVIVSLIAKRNNREYRPTKILGLTIVLMLAPNPLLLFFDPSFQLSVLATFGLIYVSPIIINYLNFITTTFNLREIVSTTIATQIMVLPLLVYNTGNVSLVSLPINILILGFIPMTMMFGFLTGFFGMINYYFGIIFGLFTNFLLSYILKIVDYGSSLSFSVIKIPNFSPLFFIIIYSVIFFILNKLKNKQI